MHQVSGECGRLPTAGRGDLELAFRRVSRSLSLLAEPFAESALLEPIS